MKAASISRLVLLRTCIYSPGVVPLPFHGHRSEKHQAREKLIDAVKRRRRAIDQKRCSLPCAEWRVGGPRYPERRSSQYMTGGGAGLGGLPSGITFGGVPRYP